MQTKQENIDIILLEEIYYTHLKTINELHFSRREIDIIACILNGRSAKRMASLLLISPKTVVNYIRNIMLRIGCNSQESIIDYIEKSGKFVFVKRYYAGLLIKIAFELELKKIFSQLKNQSISCLIVYPKEEKNKISFVPQLEKHLKLAGIITFIEEVENHYDSIQLINKMETQHVNYIIYCLSEPLIEAMQLNNNREELDVFDLTVVDNIKDIPVIFLLLDGEPSTMLKRKLFDLEHIALAEQKNYYFLVFEILKKLSPSIIIDKNISDFKKQYETLFDPHSLQMGIKEEKSLVKENTNNVLNMQKRRKILAMLAGISCLILIAILSLTLGKQFLKLKPQDLITSKPSSQLIQIETGDFVSWNLPRQDHIFVGRKELLEDLYRKLQSDQHTDVQIPFDKDQKTITNTLAISACAGLGGIGKTQLVLQYVHHAKHPYTLKAWFSAENLDQLRQKYFEFAKMLGYENRDPSIETIIIYVKNWLTKHPGWLLIYDNVESYEKIAPFLPESGGHVILTTRQRDWPTKFKILPVDIMKEEEAIALIQSLIKRNIEEQEMKEAKELVNILGCLPIAIAQAGAYIQKNQISIVEYLKLYKNHEQELLSDNTLPKGTNSLPVAITWNISLEAIANKARLNREPSLAHELLMICAYLAPEKISRQMLLTWLQKAYPNSSSSQIVLNKQLNLLWQYSMINFDGNNFISIHRLLQTVLRYQHKRFPAKKNVENPLLTPIWYKILLEATHDEFKRKTTVLENEDRQRNLLPHLQSLITHYNSFSSNNIPLNLSYILQDTGIIFHSLMAEPEHASGYYEKALEIQEKHLGRRHPEVALTLNLLGSSYWKLGYIKQAEVFHERALEIQEHYYGKEHIEVASTLDFIGRIYRDLGDIKQAKELYEHALKIQEHHYGKEHFEIASTLDLLGRIYIDLGDIKQAKALHERALKIKEDHYGKEHFEIASTLNYLGRAYRKLGDNVLSKTLHERALKINEHHYGKEHLEVALTLSYLGRTYMNLGDIQQAKAILEHDLEITEKYYGKEHFQVAFSLDSLGNAYMELGDIKQAKVLHERALKIKEDHFGKEYPVVAYTLDNLGHIYKDLGDIKQAKALHERALKIKEHRYGKEHFEIAFTLDFLGRIYRDLGDIKQAKALHERALKIKEDHYGKEHPKVAIPLDFLGRVYRDLGDIKQAKVLHERALKIKEDYYGKEHFIVAFTLDFLGCVYRDLGDIKQAKALHERALKIKENHYGKEHFEVTFTLNYLGCVYRDLGDIKQAKALHERALKIKEDHYGKDHTKLATTLTNLGIATEILGDFSGGQQLIKRAHKIVINYFDYDQSHPLIKEIAQHIKEG